MWLSRLYAGRLLSAGGEIRLAGASGIANDYANKQPQSGKIPDD